MRGSLIRECLREKVDEPSYGSSIFHFNRRTVTLWINQKPYEYNNVIQINTEYLKSIRGDKINIAVLTNEIICHEEQEVEITQLRANMKIKLKDITDFGVSVVK